MLFEFHKDAQRHRIRIFCIKNKKEKEAGAGIYSSWRVPYNIKICNYIIVVVVIWLDWDVWYMGWSYKEPLSMGLYGLVGAGMKWFGLIRALVGLGCLTFLHSWPISNDNTTNVPTIQLINPRVEKLSTRGKLLAKIVSYLKTQINQNMIYQISYNVKIH